MRFASLGSGSQGNALVVEVRNTRLLLDCGFSVPEVTRRLARLGLDPAGLSAVVLTHEHDDHLGSVARLARRYRLPVWLTSGTFRGLEAMFQPDLALHFICGYQPFAVGDILVEPFPVPHDAREPAQYVFGDGAQRLGVLTDAGHVTVHMTRCLNHCDALVLECNHDAQLLQAGDYPEPLKQRIAGRLGHLDNESAAALLGRVDRRRLQHVVAAHLSQSNNRPDLARTALAAALECTPGWVAVADQELGTDWYNVA